MHIFTWHTCMHTYIHTCMHAYVHTVHGYVLLLACGRSSAPTGPKMGPQYKNRKDFMPICLSAVNILIFNRSQQSPPYRN